MDWGSAIFAGIIGTVAMTVLMYMGKAIGMPMDMPLLLGLMVRDDGSAGTYVVGGIVHLMMGAAFGIVYAALFDLLKVDPTWGWGALFGAVHGVIAGFALGMMPAFHPRMGTGKALAAPGLFGVRYGAMMPAGIVLLHILFGIIVAGLYSV